MAINILKKIINPAVEPVRSAIVTARLDGYRYKINVAGEVLEAWSKASRSYVRGNAVRVRGLEIIGREPSAIKKYEV